MAGPDSGTIYVIDASGWISIEDHPAHNKILYCLVGLIEEGRIKSPSEVWDELIKCDWVLAWIGQHRKRIVPTMTDPEYFAMVGRVALDFPAMCSTRGSKEKGDGYVVAMAAHGAATSNPTRWVAVASETLASKPNRKIPKACEAYGVECIGLFEMLKREFPDDGW